MRRVQVFALLALASCGKPANDKEAGPEASSPGVSLTAPASAPASPAEPFEPQPVTYAEIERAGLVGAGCAFLPAGSAGADAVLVTSSEGALMMKGGKAITLTPDVDSPELPYGTRKAYIGDGLSLEIDKGAGEGTVSGEETVRWPGTLTVRDQQHRISYQAAGSLDCGA